MRRFVRLFFLHLVALLARPLVRHSSHQPCRVLYIKPDHLGDLLLATPVFQALRESYPAAEITALVGPWSQAVLARNPDIDRLLTCPFPGFERAKLERQPALLRRLSSLARPYALLAKYALLLRAHRYDVALVGRDDHWWGAALAMLAGVPVRVGFAVPECRPFLSEELPWDPQAHVTISGAGVGGCARRRTSDE